MKIPCGSREGGRRIRERRGKDGDGGYIESHEDVPFLFIGDGEAAGCYAIALTFFDECFYCFRRGD